jgi:mRNA interferase RelE/StbE
VTVWSVELTSAAVRGLDRLPPRVVPAVIEFLYGPLTENPDRVGKPLRGDLAGLFGGRRGDYRVLYEIDRSSGTVIVHRVRHRADAYRPTGT